MFEKRHVEGQEKQKKALEVHIKIFKEQKKITNFLTLSVFFFSQFLAKTGLIFL